MESKQMTALALAGGGILGYAQSIILTEYEKRLGQLSYQKFDIIGGTSVGSIVGAPLSIGIPASKVQSFFTSSGPLIFKHKNVIIQDIEEVIGPKYGSEQIEAALIEMLGDATLKDCKTKFIAVSYDYATDSPIYFKSYEKSSKDDCSITIGYDSDIKLWQVCRASAAAQSYFPGYKYGDLYCLDGGNTSDNAPDCLLVAESTSFTTIDKLKMLSLGTGTSKWEVNATEMLNPGIIRAGLTTVKVIFSAGVDAQVYKAKRMLGNNHYYISPNYAESKIEIDDISRLDIICEAANKSIIQCTATIDEFCH
jgi:patatin-like phospholipase/acyl hydrolase